MGAVERRLWRDDRRAGAAYTGIGLGIGVAAGAIVRSTPVALVVAVAAHQLHSVALDIGRLLEDQDLAAARQALPSLVGRNAAELDASGIAAAVVESVAENSVDAVIAPMFWALVAGAPGALGYRAVNTMDAMVGHRSERYERFGWASARLDDVANWVPARLFACLVALAAPKRAREIKRAVTNDAPAHPSPNAGVAEAAVAAALGVELGGPLRYGERVENRPPLGAGPRPTAANIDDAIQIASRAEWLFAAIAAAAVALQFAHRTTRP